MPGTRSSKWKLVASALVLLMVPGLALFYGGLVRSRAALNTLMMSFGALAVVTVQWTTVGYSLAFAPGSLIASAPFPSPLHSFGRYFARCASVPLAYRLLTHRLECAP